VDYQNLTQRDVRHLRLDEDARRPRHHYWLGLAAIPIIVASFFSLASDNRGASAPQAQAEVTKAAEAQETLALILPESVLAEPDQATAEEADAAMEMTASIPETTESPAASEPDAEWMTVTVRPGDSLARIFSRESLGARTLHDIMSLGGDTRILTRIHPGDILEYQLDTEQGLRALRYRINPLNEILVTRGDDGFQVEQLTHVPETQIAHAIGTIDSSLFLAAQKAGLSDNLTMALAGVFGYDVDFALDIRQGDSFAVIYEDRYLDGEFIGHGNILAAEFINQGRRYQAVRYTDAGGNTDYYTPEGKSLRKAFLRTPVSVSRISSHFNPNRRHPVLNTIRAHRGVDYAAPTGTPIMATGAGKVVHIGNKGGYGRTIILQHGTQYSTLYAHMSRYARGLRTGSRVQQGDVIGYIGSSGLATGPHLHYEFLVNGVHRNPLTVKLPDAEPIRADYKADFMVTAQTLLAQLESRTQMALAALEP
jgi:murein DD-endopeptidase MepM/ murein hydrolase activator NlpD